MSRRAAAVNAEAELPPLERLEAMAKRYKDAGGTWSINGPNDPEDDHAIADDLIIALLNERDSETAERVVAALREMILWYA